MKPGSIKKDLEEALKFFQNSISCLSEEDSSYKPTEDALTVAEQVAHTAKTIEWFVNGATSPEGFDINFEAHWIGVKGLSSLNEAKSKLDKAVATAVEVLTNMTEEELDSPLPPGLVMPGEPKWSVITGIVDHTAHHRGALTVYSRLLGKTPRMPYM